MLKGNSALITKIKNLFSTKKTEKRPGSGNESIRKWKKNITTGNDYTDLERRMCEYVGLLCKHAALQGLTLWYSCYKECKWFEHEEELLGEGDFILTYSGFDWNQSEHGRAFFCEGEYNGKSSIVFSTSFGVQGPGEHYYFDFVYDPTEKQIRDHIMIMADWLRKKRIPVDPPS